MKLTQEQYDALAPFEKHFESAVNHRWVRFPGGAALDMIHDILHDVTGLNLHVNKCCSHCILELVTEMGKVFLADRDERKEAERKVEVKETEVEVVKTEVKTKRGGRKRSKVQE